jgi:hypothetical protein
MQRFLNKQIKVDFLEVVIVLGQRRHFKLARLLLSRRWYLQTIWCQIWILGLSPLQIRFQQIFGFCSLQNELCQIAWFLLVFEDVKVLKLKKLRWALGEKYLAYQSPPISLKSEPLQCPCQNFDFNGGKGLAMICSPTFYLIIWRTWAN